MTPKRRFEGEKKRVAALTDLKSQIESTAAATEDNKLQAALAMYIYCTDLIYNNININVFLRCLAVAKGAFMGYRLPRMRLGLC